ncbi:MAG: amino acid adenylation domain-containing protein [Pseudomonadota bacterium]
MVDLELTSAVSVASHFDAVVAERPDAIALRGRDVLTSYRALSDQVDAVAGTLHHQDVQPGEHVALFASRSREAIVGMLACLKVGAVYVPMDPTFAPEHLSVIIEDVPFVAVLSYGELLSEAESWFAEDRIPVTDMNGCVQTHFETVVVEGDAPACILYTSGTTGRPKGVVVPHRAISSMAVDQPELCLTSDDIVLNAATIACDGALAETLVPLIAGASVALVEAATPELQDVADTMTRHKVTVALWYAGLHHLMIAHRIEAFETVRISEQGGDVMSAPMAKKLLTTWPNLRLFNGFGPTETCVRSTLHEVSLEDVASGTIPIGRAMTAEEVVILDESLRPATSGQIGQMAIGGVGVALGYFQRPESTARAFIADPRPGFDGLLYLTGDLAWEDETGLFHFAGRGDRQVKMAGRRVEIDGVEHALRDVRGVEDAVVELVTGAQGTKQLVAYIAATAATVDTEQFISRLRQQTANAIARDVFPRRVEVLESFPLTRAGKVDRKALRAMEPTSSPVEVPKADDIQGRIAAIWQSVLGSGPPAAKDTFFDLGGTSLQLIDAHAQIEDALSLRFPIAEMFELARLGDLAQHLAAKSGTPSADDPTKLAGSRREATGAIAIVGMAARLPGGVDFSEFWDVIRDGRSLIETFAKNEAEDAFDAENRAGDAYVPARSMLRDVDMFDSKFFDMRPKEAAVTDPQGRVFLEICQEALDHAGIDPERATGGIGVYAGAPMSTYMLENLLSDREKVQNFTSGFQIDYSILAGNDSSDLATRVAFKLGLKGPAMSVSTACSTSLVAVAQAVQALRNGDTDAALAGGVSITFPQKRGYLYMESGMASSDGLCRPFDADASGTVFGHGAGVIVLKRLEDALRDGDHIHAVIRGVGLNNDGADKMSYTAPSVKGQADAIRAAQRDGGVHPSQIGYVECHGTGTPLGDPIEIAGLAQAFGENDGQCALGAVKGNLGHLDAAAGVMGVIKAAKVLSEKTIPPVAYFQKLNDRITLEGTPFWVPDSAQAWDTINRRFAGVSSFGVGGTNAHIVMEEAPATSYEAAEGAQILPLSAKSPEALEQMAKDLAVALADTSLADAAFTLQDGRRAFDHRVAIAAKDKDEAIAALKKVQTTKAPIQGGGGDLVFLLPGQGAQYPGMGSDLYETEPVYREWIDAGAGILEPIIGQDIRPLLLGRHLSSEEASAALRETRFTQPALYLTEFALGKLWEDKGIRPDAMIGHSVGEFAAAALAGIMTFADALGLIAARGQLMQDQPSGSMLSVRATLADLQPHLDENVDLAAKNAPKLQVVAGPDAAIDALAERLEASGIAFQRLHTSHAFHSKMMDPVALALFDLAEKIDLRVPEVPIYSTVLGRLLTAEKATDPAYWAAQARASVNFKGAVEAAAADLSPVFLELGPGRTLTTCAAQSLPREVIRGSAQSLPDHTRPVADDVAVAQAAGGLWSAGLDLNWSTLGPRGNRKVPLPSYAFQRQRHWIDPPATSPATAQPLVTVPVPPTPESLPMSTSAPIARQPRLREELSAMLADMSGEDIGPGEQDVTFVELGFDSLFLGQVSQEINRAYGVSIGFRKMLSDLSSVSALAVYLDAEMPEDIVSPLVAAPEPATMAVAPVSGPSTVTPGAVPGAEGLVQAQLQTMQAIFAQQLQALGQAPAPTAVAPMVPAPVSRPAKPDTLIDNDAGKPETFKFGRGPSVAGGTLTDQQVNFAKELAARYSAKHAKSKAYTAEHRGVLADPRTAAGFRSEWKELTFPIVADSSKGAFIDDLDGNRFIDLVNGFGQTAFGHSPGFVIDAVNKQMAKGFPIGPQADAAGPVAQKFADAVGHERVTFCNTGSEAVMAAMRVARTVTGRDLIVVFDRDYHGQFDEVLIKGKASGKSADPLPIAPGIPRSGLQNMKVLPYGGEAALAWIRENIKDVAAVIVEPVQSRHPEHRPEDFVREVRKITEANGAALVIDEVVTGFRTSARGMQGVWGIQGDLATYGKVVGGGMPIGVLAGDAKFMDALDGGAWQFGDDSTPEAVPTFFAGTFVRHPLVLAAVDATLDHMAASGDELWSTVAARTATVANRLSQIMLDRGLPDLIESYSSWFVMNVTEADPRATLLYPLMRMDGIHVMDGFCCFLTTEHGEAECEKVVAAFEKALDSLLSVGILADLLEVSDTAPSTTSLKELATLPAAQEIPLTASQKEIWMTHQLGGMAAAAFNESGSLDMRGQLDVLALQSAWVQLIARHDALRLRFAKDGSTFTVSDADAPKLMQFDLRGDPDPHEALDELIAEDGATPFDITASFPIRGVIATLSEDRHVLVITAHHIVADGWSFGVMLADLADLYSAAVAGKAADLPEQASFAAHALAEAQAGTAAATKSFWTDMHTPAPALPELPSDRPRPEQRSFAGDTVFHEIDGELVTQAKKTGAKAGCTLFATTFAAMQILVNRISGADDFALGVPTAAQQNLDNPELVGHCVNFLPIRVPFATSTSIGDHLTAVRDQLNAALEHQDTTFGAIIQDLDLPRALNRLPLAEVEFNLEQDKPLEAMTGLEIDFRPNAKRAVNFDLFFNVVETATGLRIEAHFNTDLYDAARVRGWAQAFEAILTSMVADIDQPARQVSLLSAEDEQARLRSDSVGGEYDRSATLTDLIERSVRVYGTSPAITDAKGAISYAELGVRVNALASLIQELVPGQGARVALCLPRGTEMVLGLLAILKAGHTYVPLDPNQPSARLRQIIEAAEVQAVLTDTAETADFSDGIDVILAGEAKTGDIPSPVSLSPQDPAYVIFTSGSTGVPKGVAVPHRALVNFLTTMAEKPGFTAADKILAVTTVMFDIAALEMFLPLTVGGLVEIAPTEMVVDGFRLVDRLNQGDITMMQATPTLWDMALMAGFAPSEGFTILCGGEALPQDLADRLLVGGATVWNMYGPTETTIWSAIKQIATGAPITIGRPIANTGLHILDAAGQLVPEGAVGELNISGDGLALGYYNRPDLTQKAFRDLMLGGEMRRLYATGDLARRTPDGEIAVLGRIDTQVKLRGFRIELGEIETRLRAQPGVSQAAVDLRKRENGDGQLVGYVVADDEARLDTSALGLALAEDLPDYMVPRAWAVLSALPQTGNGKLDRKALPDPQSTASITPLHQVVPAATDTEKRIAAIWAKVLERDALSVTETLHALGVDSLAMFRIASHMLNDGLNLEAKHMFAHPSIRDLAAFYDGREASGATAQRPSLKAYRGGARRGDTGGAV